MNQGHLTAPSLRRRNRKEKNMSEDNVIAMEEIEGYELDAGIEPTAEEIAEAEAEAAKEE